MRTIGDVKEQRGLYGFNNLETDNSIRR